ncbi:hypothetical protein SKAU_G00061970 [Synaphobranchus kaupii]|uniref:Uncharacterized protein n=1 Tax=Synaphobranchus kaupii TaxID=118154 RepID=A0A9Q1JAV4_SYNKA|nr:hypothetical protein SKAU_G00061970 [Synaphobranchus kaupii]
MAMSRECCGKGVLESKYPFKWTNDQSPDKWTEDKRGHLETLMSMKTKYPYYTQLQFQMFVANFITWTPQQSVIFRVPREEDFIHNAVDSISKFCARHIYPRLAGMSDLAVDQEVQRRSVFRQCREEQYSKVDEREPGRLPCRWIKTEG